MNSLRRMRGGQPVPCDEHRSAAPLGRSKAGWRGCIGWQSGRKGEDEHGEHGKVRSSMGTDSF